MFPKLLITLFFSLLCFLLKYEYEAYHKTGLRKAFNVNYVRKLTENTEKDNEDDNNLVQIHEEIDRELYARWFIFEGRINLEWLKIRKGQKMIQDYLTFESWRQLILKSDEHNMDEYRSNLRKWYDHFPVIEEQCNHYIKENEDKFFDWKDQLREYVLSGNNHNWMHQANSEWLQIKVEIIQNIKLWMEEQKKKWDEWIKDAFPSNNENADR